MAEDEAEEKKTSEWAGPRIGGRKSHSKRRRKMAKAAKKAKRRKKR